MGKLALANPPGKLVSQVDPMISDIQNKGHVGVRKCSACGTVVSAGHFPGPLHKAEWQAPHECPTCWSIQESLLHGGS